MPSCASGSRRHESKPSGEVEQGLILRTAETSFKAGVETGLMLQGK